MNARLCALAGVLALAGSIGTESAQLVVVRGRVVAQDDEAAAMRGARVMLVGSAATADPVFTDAEGRFALGVPTSYTLTIAKAGYAPAIVSGRATASDGELRVRLSRGAVITGRVTDELGFAVVNAGVRVRRLQPSSSEVAAGLVQFTTETDDAGAFRVGSLPPGRYAVHSEPRSPLLDGLGRMALADVDVARTEAIRRELALRQPPPMSDDVTVEARAGEESVISLAHKARAVTPTDAPTGGFVSGMVVDRFGEPVEGVTIRAWRVRFAEGRSIAQPAAAPSRTDDRGQYRLFHVPPGRYVVVAAPDEPQFAAVYHPGVTSIASAASITVGRSQEVPGVHISFDRTREARVSGRVVDTRPGQTVTLYSGKVAAIALPPRLAMPGDDGAFEFLNVPPGQYVVMTSRANGPLRAPDYASGLVTVSTSDPAPVTLAPQPTATISGQLVVEGSALDPSRDVRVVAVMDPDVMPLGTRAFGSLIAPDGSFQFLGLVGPTRFVLAEAPPGYWLKSVDLGSVNAAEESVLVKSAEDSRSNVRIVVADSAGTIAGRVADADGQVPDDFRVVAFATSRERWFASSPYVRMTGGPDADDGFSLRSLPPGEYFVAAVDALDGDGESGDWQNPDFLERLALTATRVTLGERQRLVTSLLMRP
jgi:hypothetical protein